MLEEQRKRIDEIDDAILKLFAERMKTVSEVATIKYENKLPIFQPEREKDIIARRGAMVQPEMKEYAEELFSLLMSLSRKYQSEIIKNKQ